MDESKGAAREEAREFWEEAVQLWRESGLAVRAFCTREGLAESSFHDWRRRFQCKEPTYTSGAEPSTNTKDTLPPKGRRQRRRAKPSDFSPSEEAAVEFQPVRVVAQEISGVRPACAEMPAEASSIEIVHASGWRVRILAGFDSATLAAVLTVLEQRPC